MTTTHDSPMQLEGAIWFRSGEQKWGNQRRMALLAAIDSQGSITAAAKHIGLSYKAAWDAIDAMNNLADKPLVLRTTGGQHGGGAQLTERAHQLLSLYQALSQEHERFMSKLASIDNQASSNLELIQHMMSQVSIRNRLLGTIDSIKSGSVNDIVTLSLGNNIQIQASITHESVHNLQLEPGKRAVALIKASSVEFSIPGIPLQLSISNQLQGYISRIVQGAVHSEVQLILDEGKTLTGVVSKDGFGSLGLKEGDKAIALFPASTVMLGVLD